MAAAAILEIENLLHFSYGLTDFHENWHNGAEWTT